MQSTLENIIAKGDIDRLIAAIPYATLIGIKATATTDDYLFTLAKKDDNLGNPFLPAIHGGAMGGFMETAGILHLLTAIKTQQIPKVIDFSIDYLRPGRHQDTFAQCQLIRQGRKIANVSITAWQKSVNSPIATARAHYLINN